MIKGRRDKEDDAITDAWKRFVDAGGQCFDWTPNAEKCPRHMVNEPEKRKDG